MGEHAAAVKLTHCELKRADADRLSSRSGQRHPLGGFVGEVEYKGELSEFMAYLHLGKWVGVGRQTVWGKGEIEITELA
jgi:CRISPR/Cas system endoribonuclease Cas6 (RAMP superfamily)